MTPIVMDLQATMALIMPARDSAAIKSYLLRPAERAAIAASTGATFCSVGGAEGLRPFLTDNTFLCLHYRLTAAGQLLPCLVAPAAALPGPPAPAAPLSAAQAPAATPAGSPCSAVMESNVQIGILVRKGIGGTSPARAVTDSPGCVLVRVANLKLLKCGSLLILLTQCDSLLSSLFTAAHPPRAGGQIAAQSRHLTRGSEHTECWPVGAADTCNSSTGPMRV